MRPIAILLAALFLSAGCYVGVSSGAYRIKEPSGDTQQAWALGVVLGYYLVHGSNRLGFGRGIEVSAPSEGPAKSYGSSMWTMRYDRSVANRVRLTGIAGMENSAWVVVDGMDDRIDFPTGKQRMLYGGATYHYGQLMVSGGPAYLRWATNEMGEATSIGAQLRITLSLSLDDILSAPSLFDGECGAICRGFKGVNTTPSKPRPRTKKESCYTSTRCSATEGKCWTRRVCRTI